MKKRRFTFGKFLWIYAGLWIVLTLVVSVKLWDVFAGYQSDYEVAAAAANPDLVMNEELVRFDEAHILEFAQEQMAKVGSYEKKERIEEYVTSLVKGKELSYQRAESFTDRKPKYDIYADDVLIGAVRMKQKPESDNFGFHMCVVDEVEAYIEEIPLQEVCIQVLAEDTVLVNGKEVSQEYVTERQLRDSMVAKKATELTNVSYETVTYVVDGLMQIPEVGLVEESRTRVLEVNENGIYEAISLADEVFVEQMQEYVLEAGEAYILNTNQMLAFGQVTPYFKAGSKAYQTVKSVQSGLTWAGKPDELEILDAQIKELVQYSENVFTVKTYYEIHRLYRDVAYDESMTFEWLYVEDDGKWVIEDFTLANE